MENKIHLEAERETNRSRVIAKEIRDWIESVSGIFNIQDLYHWMPELSKNTADKRYISKCLSRMVGQNMLERDGKYGVYRKIQTDLERMDFAGASSKGVDIWLPFDLGNYVDIMPGGIVLIAGLEDSGKTTITLNIAWANRNKWNVHYFNSELGTNGLKRRVEEFPGTEAMQWQEAINLLQSKPDLRQRLGEQAQKDAREKYTWEARAKRIVDGLKIESKILKTK